LVPALLPRQVLGALGGSNRLFAGFGFLVFKTAQFFSNHSHYFSFFYKFLPDFRFCL